MLGLKKNPKMCLIKWELIICYSNQSKLICSVGLFIVRFRGVVLEKNGENQVDRSREKWSITKNQGGEEYPTNNKKKDG
jgi:hypothetical protein